MSNERILEGFRRFVLEIPSEEIEKSKIMKDVPERIWLAACEFMRQEIEKKVIVCKLCKGFGSNKSFFKMKNGDGFICTECNNETWGG